METNTYLFDGGIVVEHQIDNEPDIARHRIIIGALASEWAGFSFLTHMAIGDRMFAARIDGRVIFPPVFEIVGGSKL